MSEESSPTKRRALVIGVVVLACVLRVATGVYRGEALLQAGNGLFFMHDLAQSIARGDGFVLDGVPSIFHQPGYVAALAAGYAVLGPTWHAVLLVNTVLGTALVGMTMRVAASLDRRAVIPAGLIAALHPFLVWHGGSVADTTLFSLALMGWLDGTLRAMRHDGPRPLIWAGVWLGVAFLTRPSLFPLIPFGFLAIWWVDRSWRKTLRAAAVSLLIAGAIALPWAVRNHGLTDRFPLMGTHGAESLWAANTVESPRATELDSSYDAVSAKYVGTELDVRAFQVDVTPHEALRREAHFRATAVAWVKENPTTFLWMCGVRFARIWDVRYHPTRMWEKPLNGVRERTLIHMLSHTPVLLLALLGAFLLFRDRERRPEALLLIAVVSVYTAAHCVGAGYTRVRLPIDPILVSLAAFALIRMRVTGRLLSRITT